MSRASLAGTWLSFRVGQRLCGLPMASIEQICPLPWVAPTVAAAAHVVGVVNAAGRTTAVIDTARRLQLSPRIAQPDHALLILSPLLGAIPSALWVDAVESLVELKDCDIEPAPRYAAVLLGSPSGDGSADLVAPDFHQARDRRELAVLFQSIAGQCRSGTEWCYLLDAERLVDGPWSSEAGDPWLFAFDPLPAAARELLMQRAAALAERPSEAVQTTPWVAFRVAAEFFAVPLLQLLEALPCPPLYPLADPLPAARSLANYRGEPLLVAELRRMVGVEPLVGGRHGAAQGSLLVVQDGAEKLGLWVDEVLEVLDLKTREVRAVTAIPWICGVLALEGRTIGLIDVDALRADPGLGAAAA